MAGEAAASRNFWSRVMRLFGFDDDLEAEEEGGRPGEPLSDREPGRVLVSLPGGARGHGRNQAADPLARYRAAGISLFQPLGFNEVQEIVDRLKHRGPVVINLGHADREMAQRILDFLGGALYALEGEMFEIGPGIYLVSPPTVNVSDLRGEGQ